VWIFRCPHELPGTAYIRRSQNLPSPKIGA
jgi:hypothetical protein